MNVERRLLNTTQAAQYLGRSPAGMRKARCDGRREGYADSPPFLKIGSRVYYDIRDLDTWIDAHRVEPCNTEKENTDE